MKAAHKWAFKTKVIRWLKIENLNTKNKDSQKSHTKIYGSKELHTIKDIILFFDFIRNALN